MAQFIPPVKSLKPTPPNVVILTCYHRFILSCIKIVIYYMFIYEVREIRWSVLELFTEVKSGCVMEQDDVRPLSLVSTSSSPVLSESTSFQVPYQSEPDNPEFFVKLCSDVKHTDQENSVLDSSSTCCPTSNRCSENFVPNRDLYVPRCPPLMFAPDLQNYSFSNGWSHYDRPLPPPPPLNLFCLPFHPCYSSALAPLVAVPPPSEHHGSMLPVQNLLARYAMASVAHLPPLLRGLFPSNPAALFPLSNQRPQVTNMLPDISLQRTSDDTAAGSVEVRTEGRRVSCDSTALICGGGDGQVMTTSSDSTSSPRVVSSTSDDFDYDDSEQHAPVDLSDVTGSSFSLL